MGNSYFRWNVVVWTALGVIISFAFVRISVLDEDIARIERQKTQLQEDNRRLMQERRDLEEQVANVLDQLSEAQKREQQIIKERDEARRASQLRATRERTGRVLRRDVSANAQVSDRSLGLKRITGYCATGNRTASGKVPRPGMVATLDRRIKFGTRVRIDGVGVFVVEDRIGHSSDFDIFFGSCGEAIRFGRQTRRVEILG